ncbi:DUF222 domain-containing protein [Microbacterium sp. 1P10UB]|uniref:HNH endonuclease signature motif containing protein n=1 Tax=unclassified Microbacterium TaxID=2609290 RepID=UPI0039A0E513
MADDGHGGFQEDNLLEPVVRPDWPDCSSSEFEPPIPDALDLVVETASLLSIVTAQQFVRIDAMRREALAEAARNGLTLTDVAERAVRLELAAALAVTESAAGAMIARADALVNRYPAALDSLAGARITPGHAAALVDALDTVESELLDDLVPRAVTLAESQAVGTFRRHLRALVEAVRSADIADRFEQAVAQRCVRVLPLADGMAELLLRMPAVEARAIMARATATARVLAKSEAESRTLEQLRLDVLSDLLIDGDTALLPPEARGIRPTVAVTVPALSLLTGEHHESPASVEGIGPIPLDRARELCGGARDWMRVLTHPETGVVLSVGRELYSPPASLRRLVKWRAETCMAPGCSIPASRCEIDHTVAWEHGGVTSLDNLAPLCKGHHSLKHHSRWCVEQIEGSGGALVWTSPAGRRYRVDPERRVPAFRVVDDGSPPPF